MLILRNSLTGELTTDLETPHVIQLSVDYLRVISEDKILFEKKLLDVVDFVSKDVLYYIGNTLFNILSPVYSIKVAIPFDTPSYDLLNRIFKEYSNGPHLRIYRDRTVVLSRMDNGLELFVLDGARQRNWFSLMPITLTESKRNGQSFGQVLYERFKLKLGAFYYVYDYNQYKFIASDIQIEERT